MENHEEIRQKVCSVVLDNLPHVTSEEVLSEGDLFSLGLDSMNALSLVLTLQDVFNAEFEMNEVSYENFRNVTRIVELIKRKKEVLHVSGKH